MSHVKIGNTFNNTTNDIHFGALDAVRASGHPTSLIVTCVSHPIGFALS
jgi:hypothetical protein